MTRAVRPVDALIVVDLQTAFVSGDHAVPDAPRLVDRARDAGALVVHLQNDGPSGAYDEPETPGWALYLPVNPGPREHVVRKPRDDGFDGTPLGRILIAEGVRSLVVCGVMSEMCVQATARTALARGYRVSFRTTRTVRTTSQKSPESARKCPHTSPPGSPPGRWATRSRAPSRSQPSPSPLRTDRRPLVQRVGEAGSWVVVRARWLLGLVTVRRPLVLVVAVRMASWDRRSRVLGAGWP